MRRGRDIEDEDLHEEVFGDAEDEEEALGGGAGADERFDIPGAGSEPGGGFPFIKSNRGIKVWVMVAGIFVVLAIGVLYVYQAGDTRTVLGNQPIPVAQQVLPVANPVPLNAPVAAPNASGGALALGTPGAGSGAATFGALPAESTGLVRCPQCGTEGLPTCSSCGAAMQPMGDGSGLYVCPACGTVGVPICPRCGRHMGAAGVVADRQRATSPPASTASGQFQCLSCGATGLPRQSATGAPLCPNCGGTMAVK